MTNFTVGKASPLDHAWDHAMRDSHDQFKDVMPHAMLFPRKPGLRRYALQRALDDVGHKGLFVEFGVWRGAGVNLFSKLLAPHDLTIHGFDSFEGLEEDWTGHHNGRESGGFSTEGKLPAVPDNVMLIDGWIQDTLPDFLDKTRPNKFTFVHMDFDTYTPTSFTLKAIKPWIQRGTVILFDELYGYPGWRNHEWKALQEELAPGSYKYIGFSTESVAIQIL
ncbi:MAG: class I SAM-dependent methyltransferase [Planktomarina sp.]